MALSFQSKIRPVATTTPTKSGLSFASKIRPVATVTPAAVPPAEKSLGQKAMGVVKSVGKFLTSSEQKFGESIAGGLSGVLPESTTGIKSIKEAESNRVETMDLLSKTIKSKRAAGQDVSKLSALLQEEIDNAPAGWETLYPSINKSVKQVLGEAGGVALDILSMGTYGSGLKTMQLGKAAPKIIAPASSKVAAFAKGALTASKEAVPMGIGFGVTQAAQENKSNTDIVKSGVVGGITSGIFSSVIGGFANRKNINPEILKQEAVDQYKKGLMLSKEKYREKADKLIPTLLEDKTWGTKKKLLDKADKGIVLSQKEYEMLGDLQGTIETPGLVGKIDDEIASLSQGGRANKEKLLLAKNNINSQIQNVKNVLSDVDAAEVVARGGGKEKLIETARTNIVDSLRRDYKLDDLADAIENNIDLKKMGDADEYQRAVNSIVDKFAPKPVSVNTTRVNTLMDLKNDILSMQLVGTTKPEAYQQDLRELAATYGRDLYDSRKAQQTINDSKTLSQVKKVDSTIRAVLSSKNPKYAEINKLYHTSTELFDIITEAKANELNGVTAKLKSVLSQLGWGAVAGTVGATSGGVVIPATAALSAAGLATLFKSTLWNSFNAVRKNNLAKKLEAMGGKELTDLMVQIYRQGPRVIVPLSKGKD